MQWITKVFEHLHIMYKTIYTVMRQDHHDDIGKIGNQSEKKIYIYMEAIRYLLRYLFITILYITFTRLIIILHQNDLVIRRSVVGVD